MVRYKPLSIDVPYKMFAMFIAGKEQERRNECLIQARYHSKTAESRQQYIRFAKEHHKMFMKMLKDAL